MLEGLQNFITGVGEDVKSFVKEKPIATAGIGAGVVGATALGVVVAKKRKKAKKKTKKKTKKGRSRDRKFISKQKHERAYVRRKKRAGKKITRKRYKTKSTSKKRVGKLYYTKKGQPYKIMASGKARFVKKTKGRKR